MARQVVWTEPAWDDVDAAAEYIARDSDYYAAAFVGEIKQAAESLCEMAERELLVRPYRLVYRLVAEEVTILAVIHGARRAKRV